MYRGWVSRPREPVHRREPAFLLFPLHFLSSAVQSTDGVGGILETPVIHRSLLQLSPPAFILPQAQGGDQGKGMEGQEQGPWATARPYLSQLWVRGLVVL